MTPDESRILAIYQELDTLHAWRGWHWWPDADPFEVCVGCILVQNTAWTNVERALGRLAEAGAMTPAAMGALTQPELEQLIRPSGQYIQKARKLREFLALADGVGGFEALMTLPAPELRSRLLGTWGIGQETADAMVIYASRQMAVVCDAYMARLFSRLGMGPGESAGYSAWQRWITPLLPTDRELWARYHALIVMHCKHLCRKRSPRCGECSLRPRCRFAAQSPLGVG